MSFILPPATFFGVVRKKAKINPIKINAAKIKRVFSHPFSTKEYLTNTGDIKYPNEPEAVTIPIAKVLLDSGKCFATTETGILIAVAPSATPINTPIAVTKYKPVLYCE